jgi:hypothetical protein
MHLTGFTGLPCEAQSFGIKNRRKSPKSRTLTDRTREDEGITSDRLSPCPNHAKWTLMTRQFRDQADQAV